MRRLFSFWRGFPSAGAALLLVPGLVLAQTGQVSVEVGASSVKPPTGVDGEAANFLVSGIRGSRIDLGGTGIAASLLMGMALDDGAGGNFFSLSVDGAAWKYFLGGWSAGLEFRGFGFDVREPYPYRAVGVEGGPSLRFASQHFMTTLKGTAGGGRSKTELRRFAQGAVRTVEDELWRVGASAEVLAGTRRLMAGLALGIHESTGGTYKSGGLRLLSGGTGPAIELRLDAWQTPMGTETTGGIAFLVPLSGWDVRGFLGRTQPDPLTLAEPGGGSGGLLLGRRILGADPLPPPRLPLHEILEYSESGATVEIRVRVPQGTRQVELAGDFTRWEPVAMEPDGDVWTVRVPIPFGTHHFGFLADDDWYLPEGAPDSVPDEWGRRNATLVIER